MPSLLALLLCFAVVAFLLRLDWKLSPAVSRASWIVTLWALISFSKPLSVWLGSGASMEAGSPVDRAFLLIVLFISILILSKRRIVWSSQIREALWPILIIALMFVSISWSAIPFISLKRWTREIIAIVMAFLVSSERDPRQATLALLRRTSYILLPFSLILIKYFPNFGVQYGRWSGKTMWIGVALQKNGLGSLCIVCGVFLIWTLFRRWKGRDTPVVKYQTPIDMSMLALAVFLLMGPNRTLNYSATSTLALAGALIAFLGLYWLKKRARTLKRNVLSIIVIAIVTYGTITPFLGRLSIMDVTSAVGRDETLTSRAQIWATLTPLAMQRPLFGHGVGGFWTTEIRALTSSHAHNGYLDVLLNIGFVGILIVFLYLLSCCREACRVMAIDFDWGVLFVCYLVMIVVHNIAESSIDSFTSSPPLVLLFILVTSARISDEHGECEKHTLPPQLL